MTRFLSIVITSVALIFGAEFDPLLLNPHLDYE